MYPCLTSYHWMHPSFNQSEKKKTPPQKISLILEMCLTITFEKSYHDYLWCPSNHDCLATVSIFHDTDGIPFGQCNN